MQSGDKRLKRKEMGVPKRNKMRQIQCAERDTGGEEREKGLLTEACGRGGEESATE
jgi:hypothetical protein